MRGTLGLLAALVASVSAVHVPGTGPHIPSPAAPPTAPVTPTTSLITVGAPPGNNMCVTGLCSPCSLLLAFPLPSLLTQRWWIETALRSSVVPDAALDRMIWELKCDDGSGGTYLASTTAANPLAMTIVSGTYCQLKGMHPSMQTSPYPGWYGVLWQGFGVNLTLASAEYEATVTFTVDGGIAQPPSAPDPPSLPPASPTAPPFPPAAPAWGVAGDGARRAPPEVQMMPGSATTARMPESPCSTASAYTGCVVLPRIIQSGHTPAANNTGAPLAPSCVGVGSVACNRDVPTARHTPLPAGTSELTNQVTFSTFASSIDDRARNGPADLTLATEGGQAPSSSVAIADFDNDGDLDGE